MRQKARLAVALTRRLAANRLRVSQPLLSCIGNAGPTGFRCFCSPQYSFRPSAQMQEAAEDSDGDFVIRVSNPARLHGRKGWRLVRIQAATGTRIMISPLQNSEITETSKAAPAEMPAVATSPPKTIHMRVSVTGPTEQIREARGLIEKELELESIRDRIQEHVAGARLLRACDDFEKLRRECLRIKSPMLISDYNIALKALALSGQAIVARRYFEYLCLSERDVQPRVGVWELFCRAAVVGGRVQVALDCLHLAQRCSITQSAALRFSKGIDISVFDRRRVLMCPSSYPRQPPDAGFWKKLSWNRPKRFDSAYSFRCSSLRLGGWRESRTCRPPPRTNWRIVLQYRDAYLVHTVICPESDAPCPACMHSNGLPANNLIGALTRHNVRARDLAASARVLPILLRRNRQRRLVCLLVREAIEAGHSALAVEFFTAALASADVDLDASSLSGGPVSMQGEETPHLPGRAGDEGKDEIETEAKDSDAGVPVEERLLRQVILCAAAHYSPR